ncbi:hypothetical protein HD806DRAFT_67295 [Xylariaceae sp. AK1471]|nr:hypothetical protein HD806DRAFT_67295 [Xylariaceae sp. AK1471]
MTNSQTKHRVAMHRAKRAGKGIYVVAEFLTFYIPKLFVWLIPKHLIALPMVKHLKWLHQRRTELLKVVADGLRKLGEELKGFPKAILKALIGISAPPFITHMLYLHCFTIRYDRSAGILSLLVSMLSTAV